MASLAFLKMHGAGNDFVVLDARTEQIALSTSVIQNMAHRQKGIGFDQLVTLKPSKEADCYMQIHNPDASISATCGNATRCVASLLFDETNKETVTIETLAGILTANRAEGGLITVNMGKPRLEWQQIPLAEAVDTLHLPISEGALQDPVAVSMGNPHAVFFVKNAAEVALEELGPHLEHHPFFPERANINVAEIVSKSEIILRVWERGAGETLACGSGACASLVAAARRNLTGRKADIHLPGGMLTIEWAENGDVLMTGDACISFTGQISYPE